MPAILDGVKNVVAAQVAGQAGQFISSGLQKVSGNLPGDWRNKMNNPSAGPSGQLEKGVKFKTKNLAYPLNVEGDPQQGHYIMFMINEQNDAKLKAMKEERKLASIAKEFAGEGGAPPISSGGVLKAGLASAGLISKNQIVGFPGGFDHKQHAPGSDPAGKRGSLQLQYQATKRLDTAISLYMPPSISVSYGMKYGEPEVGILGESIAAGIKEGKATSGSLTTKATAGVHKAVDVGAEAGTTKLTQGLLDTVAPGAKALMQMEAGKIIAPRMEIMFEGVGRRDFSYEFTFIPKSAKESIVVEEIIYAFKFHMHPEFTDESARMMRFPSTFDILYMYSNGPNNFLNKISTCFLKSMNVQYGADRFTAYEPIKGKRGFGPPPQKTKLSLSFSEMEILTKKRISQGF